jgi:hypothetical protein
LRMRASSEETWRKAANRGFSIPTLRSRNPSMSCPHHHPAGAVPAGQGEGALGVASRDGSEGDLRQGRKPILAGGIGRDEDPRITAFQLPADAWVEVANAQNTMTRTYAGVFVRSTRGEDSSHRDAACR